MDIELGYVPRDAAASAALRERLIDGLRGWAETRLNSRLALCAADWLRVFEQLAAIDLSLSQLAGVATPALKAELLADLATGRALASYAQTEPGAGSDTAKLATTARRGADGRWVVDGEKTYIGNAGWASVFTVFAKTDDGLRPPANVRIACPPPGADPPPGGSAGRAGPCARRLANRPVLADRLSPAADPVRHRSSSVP